MTFFARPNLSDEQFKQLNGTTLTLSGQTQIANPTGFSLSPDGTTFIPIIVTGGTNYDVLTYINGQIVLNVPSSGSSTGYYTCASPTTITVGGLPANSSISGCSISKILEEILVPTVSPSVINPFDVFSVTPSYSVLELGQIITFTGCSIFDLGSVNPQYCGTASIRSAGVTAYCYTVNGAGAAVPYTATTNTNLFNNILIQSGINFLSSSFCYAVGSTPVFNSSGGIYCTALSAGQTPAVCCVMCGVLPWYYSKKTSLPITCDDVPAGTKGPIAILASSTLSIVYNSSSTDYLWFAVPQGTPLKTCWYVTGLNNGCIGGTNNLFFCCGSFPINSCQGYWTGCCYDIYVTCFQTGTDPGTCMCMS